MSSVNERRFIRACRSQPVDRIPVWMMRQAGRYQKEYRALKERVWRFWNLCTDADALAEATLFAQRSLDTDAAIIFSDITVPGWAMGVNLEFVPGPKFERPIRDMDAIRSLKEIDPARDMDFLMDGIRKTRAGLPDDCSLIGFVGAPVTVAGYMIEGYPSRNWVELKKLAYGEPKVMEALLDRVTDALIAHARAQVEAGCDCIQLFDSTAGQLSANELHRFAFGSSKKVIEALSDLDVPIIYFARDVGAHLEAAADLGADVLGVDWTVSMADARRRVGSSVALQGNLDPGVLFCSGDEVERRVNVILDEAAGEPGFVFNLGHGIVIETPPENAKRVVDTVHAWKV